MQVAIITTTIHKPVLLEAYIRNAKKWGHDSVRFVVIGDLKTPPETHEYCQNLGKKSGYEVAYYDVPSQEKLLANFPALYRHLPFNSIQRRNIGLIEAYIKGADVIITIDDDNYLYGDGDFIGEHCRAGKKQVVNTVRSTDGWFNVCEMLQEKNHLPFYHRGFPLSRRWLKGKIKSIRTQRYIVVNAGLWLDAPDIDALTWLDLPIKATSMKKKYRKGVALERKTWSPFNSQNTALAREVIPAYFLSPNIGRYDDIWASYIVKKIADHLNHSIHFGFPLVEQKRNQHNYFVDFDKERLGMELTDSFLEKLGELKLTEKSYHECFGEIVDWLNNDKEWFLKANRKEFVKPVEAMVKGMRLWHRAFETIK